MPTHRRTWQKTEDRAARFFGSRRRVLSGSANRGDIGGDDASHPTLFIESKLRDTHAVRTLFEQVKRRAEREGKVPVLALFDKHKHGFMLCVHDSDFLYVIAQRIAALDTDPEGRAELDFLVEQARTRRAPGWSRGGQ
jgi:hypothetical protein